MAKTKQGHCPKCGSEDIDYVGVPEYVLKMIVDDYQKTELDYEFECTECGHRFIEIYKQRYSRTEEVEVEG